MKRQHVIAQIDIVTPVEVYGPGESKIWNFTASVSSEDQAASFWTVNFNASFEGVETEPQIVGTVLEDNVPLARANSYEDMRSSPGSFYFNTASQIGSVHFSNSDPPYRFDKIALGEALLFSDSVKELNGKPLLSDIDGIRLVPRLSGNIRDTLKADDLGKGKFYYSGFGFTIDNPDGAYDDIRASVINSGGRLLLAELPEGQIPKLSDFEQIVTGFVTEVSFPDDLTVDFDISDPRQNFEQKVNTELITAADYPDAGSKIGKRKPLLLGRAKVPGVKVAAGVYLFSSVLYGDLTAVHGVTVDGSAVSFTPNLAAGTVTLSGDPSGSIEIDATGINITNVVDQLIFLFGEFGNIPETASNFNLSEVQDIRDKGYTGALYIDEGGEKLGKLIQDVSLGINTRVYPQVGGVYGFRDLTIKASVDTIKATELVAFPERSYDDEKYFSDITALYALNYTTEEYESLTDESSKAIAITRQRSAVSGEFESTVDNESDAQALITMRYEQSIEPPVTLEVESAAPLRFGLLDYVNFELARFRDPYHLDKSIIVENSKYRVESISRINREATLVRVGEVDPSEADLNVYLFQVVDEKLCFNATPTGNDYTMIAESPYG